MKFANYIKCACLVLGFSAVLSSCEDQPDAFKPTSGKPLVHYVRYADQDIIIDRAYMEESVCLVGENLRSVNELFFNDQKAILNTSFMTDNTLLVSVPKNMATVTTNKIYLITAAKDTVKYDFQVLPPAPVIKSMSNEWAAVGEVVSILGDYFFASDTEPVQVSFPNAEVTEFISVEKTKISFKVPEGAVEGKIKVSTMSGTAQSVFHYRDRRGIITNFDGATDVVPQGWNIAATYSSEGGLDGQ